MPKRRIFRKSFQALPLITAFAVALSLFLAHNSTQLQQDSPPPANPGEKDDKPAEKPADDPQDNNPATPPADQDDKPPPNEPPNPDGKKPAPEPGVPSIPE
jgi:cytoskeletal protein RodZ